MQAFEIKGINGSIKISVIEIFPGHEGSAPMGGKECRYRLQISNEGFSVDDEFYSSMGQFTDLQSKLTKLYEDLEGSCSTHNPYEDNLELQFIVQTGGRMVVKGKYFKLSEEHIELNFEFKSDQSYLNHTLTELRSFCQSV